MNSFTPHFFPTRRNQARGTFLNNCNCLNRKSFLLGNFGSRSCIRARPRSADSSIRTFEAMIGPTSFSIVSIRALFLVICSCRRGLWIIRGAARCVFQSRNILNRMRLYSQGKVATLRSLSQTNSRNIRWSPLNSFSRTAMLQSRINASTSGLRRKTITPPLYCGNAFGSDLRQNV